MKDDKTQEANSEDSKHYLPFCMCIGLAIGTGIGVALNNMTTFMCIGMSLGVAIGAMLDAKHTEDHSAFEDVNENEEIQN